VVKLNGTTAELRKLFRHRQPAALLPTSEATYTTRWASVLQPHFPV